MRDQSIRFYLYSPYSQITTSLIGPNKVYTGGGPHPLSLTPRLRTNYQDRNTSDASPRTGRQVGEFCDYTSLRSALISPKSPPSLRATLTLSRLLRTGCCRHRERTQTRQALGPGTRCQKSHPPLSSSSFPPPLARLNHRCQAEGWWSPSA